MPSIGVLGQFASGIVSSVLDFVPQNCLAFFLYASEFLERCQQFGSQQWSVPPGKNRKGKTKSETTNVVRNKRVDKTAFLQERQKCIGPVWHGFKAPKQFFGSVWIEY